MGTRAGPQCITWTQGKRRLRLASSVFKTLILMSNHTGLTLVAHTTAGNLLFQAADHTVYVCREASHGAEVFKSNHGKYLNTAGTLSVTHKGFGFHQTACPCCQHESNCPTCRCTDTALEIDFKTSAGGILHRIYDMVPDSAKKQVNKFTSKSTSDLHEANFKIEDRKRLKAISDLKSMFKDLPKEKEVQEIEHFFENKLSESKHKESYDRKNGLYTIGGKKANGEGETPGGGDGKEANGEGETPGA